MINKYLITLAFSIFVSWTNFTLIAQQCKNDDIMNRKAAVAGQFYSSNKEQLYNDLKNLFNNKKSDSNAIAVISPHAGYVFSGEIAARAISNINPCKQYENIFIIASSHTNYFEGVSIYNAGNYETPLGSVKVNIDICNELIQKNDIFNFLPEAHKTEHSIEVQLPFLQYWLKNDFQIVPIVIGSDDIETPKRVAQILKPYFNKENVFIISTDFSHYPEYKDAISIDANTADAICTGNPDLLINIIKNTKSSKVNNLLTNICGWSATLTLMHMSGNEYNYNKLEYRNSGDSKYGSLDKVVGYWAISVTNKDNKTSFYLDELDKRELLKLARETVELKVNENKKNTVSENKYSKSLNEYCGAFVTLHKNSNLRGCVGRFEPNIPLYQVVIDMAIAASTEDYRFPLVSKEELEHIEYEVSVLTPMKKIQSIDEIELGKHGIYIKKGYKGGTFLPQVAKETGWSLEEFLGHCARDKAGLSYTGWKDADIYIYEAIVFSEKDFVIEKKENITKYYDKLDDRKVKCNLCPHNCVISESSLGFCNARKNINGELQSLSYAKPVALHIDPVEKKPLYHFIPGSKTMSLGTAGCNLKCKNCQNSNISQASPDNVEYIPASSMQIIQAAFEKKCNSISYTYTEPTVFYEYMLETAKLAHEYGLKNIMISNGYINEKPLLELIPYIDATNIDLKCFNDSIYNKMSSASLAPVLNTLKILRENNVWLEITYLIIPDWTNDMNMISEMCEWLVENGFEDVPLHFSRFFPSYKMSDIKPTLIENLEEAAKIAKEKGIKYVYLGNIHNKNINTICNTCGFNLIERNSYDIINNDFTGVCPSCKSKICGVWE